MVHVPSIPVSVNFHIVPPHCVFFSRPDRNAEREMNTETFGVSNFRGHRRYQGRGRGRGRGRGYYGNRGGQRYGSRECTCRL